MVFLAKEEARHRIFLVSHYIKLRIYPHSPERINAILALVVQHHEKFYVNRKFSNKITPTIIEFCIDTIQPS